VLELGVPGELGELGGLEELEELGGLGGDDWLLCELGGVAQPSSKVAAARIART